MKKLLFGLIATIMFGFVGNAQDKLTVDFSSRISEEHKLDSHEELVTVKEFNKEMNGTIIVIGYQDKEVIKIASVKVQYNSEESYARALALSADGCSGGYRACARGCNSNPTELGVLLCIGYCIIDCSGN